MGIEDYSTIAASNNSAVPDGWPEGMAPSGVNDSARQNMADTRTWYETAEWIDFGDDTVFASATTFTIAGIDATSRYTVGRWLRIIGSSTGTIYRYITNSVFSTDTTVTINAGTLINETLTISFGILDSANSSIPATFVSDLTAITTLQDADVILIGDDSDNNSNKKITVDNFKTTISFITTVSRQRFTASGTYTPTAGMLFADIEVWGGGGAGGGAQSGFTGSTGGGGGAGGYARIIASAATIGASQTVTIGAGGTGVSAGNGNNGSTTSLGSICDATGGSGGTTSGGAANPSMAGAGGAGTTGGILKIGNAGGAGISVTGSSSIPIGGQGGASSLGGVAAVTVVNGDTAGATSTANSGSGGGGASSKSTAQTGGNGGSGFIIIKEYIS